MKYKSLEECAWSIDNKNDIYNAAFTACTRLIDAFASIVSLIFNVFVVCPTIVCLLINFNDFGRKLWLITLVFELFVWILVSSMKNAAKRVYVNQWKDAKIIMARNEFSKLSTFHQYSDAQKDLIFNNQILPIVNN